MPNWIRCAGAVLAALVLVGCAPAAPAEPPAPEPAITPGTLGRVALDDRLFGFYVGQGYDPATPTALVVALHGYTSNTQEVFDFFGLPEIADQRGLLVALPEGSQNRQGDRFWNASHACCDFYGVGIDDSTYITEVIQAVDEGYAVDPGRVFVVGHSNGGFMAHRMACEHPDLIAAVASVSGAMDIEPDCEPSRAVSVLQVHGDADETVLFDGGFIEGVPYTSAEATVSFWQDANSCPVDAGQAGAILDADTLVAGEDLTPTTWAGCRDGTQVGLWTITGGSHVPDLTSDFTEAVVDWFEANARS